MCHNIISHITKVLQKNMNNLTNKIINSNVQRVNNTFMIIAVFDHSILRIIMIILKKVLEKIIKQIVTTIPNKITKRL